MYKRWTQAHLPTLRDNPQDAEIDSHRLLVRAGLVRKLSGGLYTFMPMGLRALHKVEQIVREEMDRAGALEILMPALQPREIWDTSGRYAVMGPAMFQLRDRQDREMVLGPTHEEVVTDLASREISSWRDLPKTFYQIQTKFRDEIRPRFGLMRAKEFIMKDAYSFDLGWDEADVSYKAMYDAYTRIFNRCGLRTKVVEADTGAMGGKWSHEFMVLADAGEDGIVECTACAYAANLERAERKVDAPSETATSAPNPALPAPVAVATPGMRTIQDVSAFFKCAPDALAKTLIYVADGKAFAVMVPGDRDANEPKIARLLQCSNLILADDAVVQRVTGAPIGFAGPVGLNVPVYADLSLRGRTNLICGGNKADTHVTGVSMAAHVPSAAFEDICIVKSGDHCPRCGAVLREQRGIEVGHVFKLGTKYSQSFKAAYLNAEGKETLCVMGCYGIGVTRTMQAVIEQNHDANGIVWPMSVAPCKVAVLPLNVSHEPSLSAARQICEALDDAGIDVILDDRDDRPGAKFKDCDLVGFPLRVVVSERSLAQGMIEIKLRRSADKPKLVPAADAVRIVIETCKAEMPPAAS